MSSIWQIFLIICFFYNNFILNFFRFDKRRIIFEHFSSVIVIIVLDGVSFTYVSFIIRTFVHAVLNNGLDSVEFIFFFTFVGNLIIPNTSRVNTLFMKQPLNSFDRLLVSN